MAISDRYERLLTRRAPEEDRVFEKYAEAYEQQPGENTKYLVGAMAPVDRRYTERLAEQGDRIQNQLEKRLEDDYPALEFRRQGSVSNYTHIRFNSDVDVLVIIDKFFTVEPPLKPKNPYNGDPKDDLLVLREDCAQSLDSAFPKAVVDNSGSTAVEISGGSLICKVDVVPANWYDTVSYNNGEGDHHRGVMVLNREEMERKKNFPFLFNYRLHGHDTNRSGVPRMLIRLLKTIKADYENDNPGSSVSFSSFDICSLAYRMPDDYLRVQLNQPLDIIRNYLRWIYTVLHDSTLRSSLKTVDDSRLIFDKTDKAPGLQTLYEDLLAIYRGAVEEQGGYRMITEAHIG